MPWQIATHDSTPQLPPLETRCARCNGTGQVSTDLKGNRLPAGERGHCWYCRGIGGQLTPAGKELLAFLKKYWK